MEGREKIILLGGGGHSKVLAELIRLSGKYEIMGILDSELEAGATICGITVLGNDELLPGLNVNGIKNACIAVGSVKDNRKRKKLYELVRSSGFYVPYLIHPQAIVSQTDTDISEGVQIMAGAIVQAGSIIGENTIINTGAIVEHDCTIGKNVHICPGAVVCGGSTIGDNSFIGAGATVIQGIEIGKDTVVGAGALVHKNLTEGVLVKGAHTK
ncbi:MAG TPA: acetyltransferase [Nitrospirae bacterium]|nr:putative acetyltransferase EpsM [bacterium BMS3Abin06]HDH11391.1 acetyltransferase [Nitrospirota bacterium]HDZ01455.1 acetyltransferase [Nitrospirota bacterium]